MSNVLSGKDKILKTIGDLDDLLMRYKKAYAAIEGIEIPEDEAEEFHNIIQKIKYLMILRNRLAKYLQNEYGIFVMNGWES